LNITINIIIPLNSLQVLAQLWLWLGSQFSFGWAERTRVILAGLEPNTDTLNKRRNNHIY